MLQNLHVKNLALIDEVEVDFTKGLNILTGETGAGKSIVLGSVSLALGGRYTADILRKGEQSGLVEITFMVENPTTVKKLEQMNIFPDHGQVIISRRLMEGRSVSRINGETVTVGQLKEAAAVLIDIHGQHEHQSLLYKKNHLTILDAFAKEAQAVKKEVETTYHAYRKLQKQLLEADTDEKQREKEIDFLTFEIEEIQNAALSEEEAEDIEERYRKMLNGKKITDHLEEVYSVTSSSDENASDSISRSVRVLSDISAYDSQAEVLYSQLVEIDNLLGDFNRDLADYMDSMTFSAEEFYDTETRLNQINHLKSKYGDTIEKILQYCQEKEERLAILNDYDIFIDGLKKDLKAKEELLKTQCDKLTKIRKKEAEHLEKTIIKGLTDLNFQEVKFEIAFSETKDYTADGKDDVEFLISLNPGESVKPLSNIASGGELSRIMLALKAALADKDEVETLIFDEIDVGISGRTAQKVSEKMGLIGQKHQVICITHLAQIAAMADTHFLIEKRSDDGVTKTEIHRLSEKESVIELARILGGAKITDAVIENAREMKNLASGLKK